MENEKTELKMIRMSEIETQEISRKRPVRRHMYLQCCLMIPVKCYMIECRLIRLRR